MVASLKLTAFVHWLKKVFNCVYKCVFGMANRHAQDEQEQYSSNQGFEGSFLFVFRITILSVILGMRQITTRKNAWVFISVSIAE